MGGCDDTCGAGGCGAGCGPGYDQTGVLSYVGAGGAYVQDTTYRYVGQGAGNFEVVPVATNIRSNICVWIIPLILLLLLVPFLPYLLPQLSAGPATLPPTPAPINTSSEPYDCQSQGMWSFDKKGWCCEHYNVGCPTTPPPTPAPPPPPRAPPPPPQSTTSPCPLIAMPGTRTWGPLQWVKGWSGAKKLYCCRTVHRGCP